tara:strand:- start:29102 stop:29830 length:729 start_codon:yes stop_codon:yes gene_type:complete
VTITLEPLIAHRGAAPYAPENTFAAFEKARELGARSIEFDVMMSADGELFVFHDANLRRTSNGRGQFGDSSSDYIASLDAGSWFSQQFRGEKIPTLKETLRWFARHSMHANIEIKPLPGRTDDTTTAVLSCINQCWSSDAPLPLLSSFNEQALLLCSRLLPELPLGLLLLNWKSDWLSRLQNVNGVSLHLPKHVVNKERINTVKNEGYAMCVYTVNSKKWARRFWEWGADAIISDYPDLMAN